MLEESTASHSVLLKDGIVNYICMLLYTFSRIFIIIIAPQSLLYSCLEVS